MALGVSYDVSEAVTGPVCLSVCILPAIRMLSTPAPEPVGVFPSTVLMDTL